MRAPILTYKLEFTFMVPTAEGSQSIETVSLTGGSNSAMTKHGKVEVQGELQTKKSAP